MESSFWFDSFEVACGGHAAKVNFKLGSYEPRNPQSEVVGVAFTSMESLKSMAFVLTRAIKQSEREQGVSFPISNKALNAQNIPYEDWEAFWR